MTTNNIQKDLQLINTKSQELLKRLEFNIDTDESLNVDEISQLQTARHELVTSFFNLYSSDEIEKEPQLINIMIKLDVDLQTKTQALKQIFASKIIKIKKGRKSTNTYSKY